MIKMGVYPFFLVGFSMDLYKLMHAFRWLPHGLCVRLWLGSPHAAQPALLTLWPPPPRQCAQPKPPKAPLMRPDSNRADTSRCGKEG